MAAQGSAKASSGLNPTGLCQCGCGEAAPLAKRTKTKIGHRKGEPVRFIPGHQFRRFHIPAEDRLRAGTVKGDGGCLIWTGPTAGAGYGVLSRANRLTYVHRLAYETAKGAIPAGLEIDHLCGVKLCVNPDHLEAVTHAENMRRMREVRANG